MSSKYSEKKPLMGSANGQILGFDAALEHTPRRYAPPLLLEGISISRSRNILLRLLESTEKLFREDGLGGTRQCDQRGRAWFFHEYHQPFHVEVENRRDVEREQLRDNQTADDGETETAS